MIVGSEEDEPAPAGAITRARAKEMIKGMQQLAEKTEEEILERVWNILLSSKSIFYTSSDHPQPRPELVSAREIVSVKNKAEKGTKQSRDYSILIIRGGKESVKSHIFLHDQFGESLKAAKASSPKVQSFIYPFHHHSRSFFTKGKGRSIESPKKNLLNRASTKKQGTPLNHHRVLEERNSSLCDLVKALAMTRPNHSINIRPSIYQEQEPNQSRPCSNCRKEKAKTSRRSQSSKPRCNYKEKSNHYELKAVP
ncbi:unnamed protein product [Cochlearia groenlandica]